MEQLQLLLENPLVLLDKSTRTFEFENYQVKAEFKLDAISFGFFGKIFADGLHRVGSISINRTPNRELAKKDPNGVWFNVGATINLNGLCTHIKGDITETTNLLKLNVDITETINIIVSSMVKSHIDKTIDLFMQSDSTMERESSVREQKLKEAIAIKEQDFKKSHTQIGLGRAKELINASKKKLKYAPSAESSTILAYDTHNGEIKTHEIVFVKMRGRVNVYVDGNHSSIKNVEAWLPSLHLPSQ
ncbi:hypothetical protein VCHA53O466_50144 [Vibrio chagasii]|nr:hypothetical protein VCHA53O466_50144 [Vibrio chagasii]